MRIKRLELQGFKSFAEPTLLEFGAGVAGIVGPNGCGKSNVVDAIRWVLGEQHPRTLRGKRMEDMVFNGSDSRKPAGMAEITMTLSNMGERLSSQWAEGDDVTVTRRLFRSGDSEYLINHRTCRLRDVVDLFLDTGLNTHSFSIVEQGRIEALLTAKVEDRREIIEEAAGIMKYKTRRNEALRKLSAAKDNLDRINDIVGEVERQTRSLERQAKRAAQYKEVQERLREVEGRLLRADYASLGKRIAPQQSAYDQRKRREAELRAEWSAADSRAEERRHQLAQREESLKRLRAQMHEGSTEIHRLETRIELFREQRKSLDSASESRADELSALDADLTAASEGLEHARAQAGRQDRMVREAEEELSRRQAELDAAREAQAAREASVEADKALVLELADRFTRTQNQIQLLSDQLRSQDRRKSQFSAERERDDQRRREIEESLEKIGLESIGVADRLEEARRREAALERKLQIQEEAISRSEETVYRLKEELAAKSSSLAALEGMADSLDASGLKRLLAGGAPEGGIGGIIARLADILEVEPGYETAIEAVLGDRLRGVVVERPADAKKALEFLRSSGSGRGSFIPRSLRGPAAGEDARPRYYEGYCPPFGEPPRFYDPRILGRATTFVRVSAGFESLIQGLLGDVRVVTDLDAAISLWEEKESIGTLVTKTGEVLDPSGILVGGVKGQGPLERRSEIERLKGERARLEEESARAESNREAEKKRRTELVAKLEEAVRARRKAEASLADVRRAVEELRGDVSRLQEGLEAYQLELDLVAEEESALQARKREAEEALRRIGRESAEAEARVKESARLLAVGRETVEAASEAVSAQRVTLAEIRIRSANLRAEVKRLEERSAEVCVRMGRLKADTEADRLKYQELERSERQARERIQHLHLQLETCGAEAKDAEEAIDRDQAFLRETQERARGLKDQVTALLEELDGISSTLSELKVERDLLCQRAQITYGIDLASAGVREEEADLPEEERGALREETGALQDRLRRMGEVNMGALSEFEQLNERYQFLKGQQEDLIRSIEGLHATIDRINRTTRRRFKDAFESINQTFSEVFRRLFGGGRAALVLTDEHNLLETGVDIIVQPPGKKLGNILLLSAGEKALTAISLLFAVFRYNPSPFCLLDEVDATLDDHNVARFIDILRELSRKTQFIVITHNKRTMSFTDVLYGVTMQEKGSSRVVSVELNQLATHETNGVMQDAEPEEAGGEPEPGGEDRWAEIEPLEETDEHGLPAQRGNGTANGSTHQEDSGGSPGSEESRAEGVPIESARNS